MKDDPIVGEIRRYRVELARQNEFDPEKVIADVKRGLNLDPSKLVKVQPRDQYLQATVESQLLSSSDLKEG
jgi:hypothetical protein